MIQLANFRRLYGKTHNRFKRNNFSSFIPRTAITLARFPVAAAGAGMGLSAYVHYQIEDWNSWFKDTFAKAKTYFDVFKGVEQDQNGIHLSLNSPSLRDNNTGENVLMHAEDERGEILLNSSSLEPNDLVGLTKTLIEVRNLLKKVNSSSSNNSLVLPSIVVIGSQSSGKSSVLEAIVGHEFLPKGSNMVTRRPIELTLVHTPNSTKEYGEFPQLKLGKITSFPKIQKILTDLNLAVTDEECVSSTPIELIISSRNVPDLTLVDLPGYIQVSTQKQPPMLKRKIIDLCEKYIKEPNIILAICAADVDLANSEALKASRRVDPLGARTIGVVSKIDLVSPDLGKKLLLNTDYPLALGYIGIFNPPGKGSLMDKVRVEETFFEQNPSYDSLNVGSTVLRTTLKDVLEKRMSASLKGIIQTVQNELEDCKYQFKVHYNDRTITPESYVAECIDVLKSRFKEFTKKFDKPVVKERIRKMLENRMVNICMSDYWSTGDSIELLGDDESRSVKLLEASAKLTRSGVGKATVQLVSMMITESLKEITDAEPWSFHDFAREQILEFSLELLRSKFGVTIDQVENTIKPFKFEVDVTDGEWKEGQRRAADTLVEQMHDIQKSVKNSKSRSGRRKLRQIMKYLAFVENNPTIAVDCPFSDLELSKARQVMDAQNLLDTISHRLAAVKSNRCSTVNGKNICPEVFLSVVAEKLASTSVLFIYIELLNEFFFQLPRQIDSKMYYSLSKEDIEKFCSQNPTIHRHLTLQEKKVTLETVMEKLVSIKNK